MPGKPNCMRKLMLVNEIVYEEKIKVSGTETVRLKRLVIELKLPHSDLIAVSPQLQEELLRHFCDHVRARRGE